MKFLKRLLFSIIVCLTAITALAAEKTDSLDASTEETISKIENSKFGPYESIKHIDLDSPSKIDFSWLEDLGELLKYAFIVIIVLAITFVVVALIAHFKGINLFGRKKDKQTTMEVENLDSIENRNFEKEIEDCLQKFDYSGAVKVIYMAVVSDLNDHDQIKWDLAKTTSDYYYEIKEAAIKKLYYSFALIYLQVRYGNAEATADMVMQAKQFRTEMSRLYPNKNTAHA